VDANNDPVARQILDELKKLDGREVAKKRTIHGEVMIIQIKGKHVEVPLEVDELRQAPVGFTDKHRDAMEILFSAVSQIAEAGVRMVPVTRNELKKQWHVAPKLLKQLENWGYIRQRIIKLVPKDQPKATKGQSVAVCYFTPQGRAYVRAEFDPKYGIPQGEGPVGDSPGSLEISSDPVQQGSP
jgi:hypothetical protein